YAGITGGLLARFDKTVALLAEARAVAQALSDQQAIALADGASGEDFLWQGRLSQAEEFNERGLALARRVGPNYYMPIFLYNAGWTALLQRRLDRAAELLNESIEAADQLGDEIVLAMALPLRGAVSLFQQDLVGARTYLQRGAHITRD